MDTQNGEDAGDVHVGAIGDLGIGLACFSEKVFNLNNFVMYLETLEGKLEEGSVLDNDDMDIDCIEKVLEFDMLCGVLDSEVRELDEVLDILHAEIADARERVLSSCSFLQQKLRDSEESLKQSEKQVSEIKKRSASFQRALSSYKREENVNVEECKILREDDQSVNAGTVIKMQTIEDQRHILRLLEESLASEMDLQKNLNDSRQMEEKLKQRVVSLEQELIFMEEEANDVWERWFVAENAREILMVISKGLLCKLQVSQFNLSGLSQRDSEFRAQLERSTKSSEIRDMENLIVELKANVSSAESQAKTAEAECRLLKETNTELNKKLTLLKDGGGASKSVELLERLLKESDLQLQHAVASAAASQEKQSMLYSTIIDMELVIKDLKSKVSKAEGRADSAEEKCMILSESNSELNEELRFLRSRLECLEGSLHQVQEAKLATAKDISKRTKVFKNLVTQLAVERERLYKQLSSLASENKILVVKLKQTCKDPSQEVIPTSATGREVDKTWKSVSANDNEVEFADSGPDVGTVRRIDAAVLNFKHFFISVLVLLILALAFLYLKDVNVNVSL